MFWPLKKELTETSEKLNSEDHKNKEISDTIEEQKRKISGLQMSLDIAEESNEEKEKLSHQVEDLQSELDVSLIIFSTLAFVT